MTSRGKMSNAGACRSRRFAVLLLTVLTVLLDASPVSAQYTPGPWQTQVNPERAIWIPTLKYIKTDVEAEQDSYHSSVGAGNQKFERLYLAPALGIAWNHYIY